MLPIFPWSIVEYLHSQTYDLEGYAHEMSWTEWGELAEAQPIFTIISEGSAPEGLNEAGEWWFELLAQSNSSSHTCRGRSAKCPHLS